MGRFEDGGDYPKDIVKGAISKVLINYIFYLGKSSPRFNFFCGKKALQGATDQDC